MKMLPVMLPLRLETWEPGPFVSGSPGKIHRSTSSTSLNRSSLPNPLTALEFKSSKFYDKIKWNKIKKNKIIECIDSYCFDRCMNFSKKVKSLTIDHNFFTSFWHFRRQTFTEGVGWRGSGLGASAEYSQGPKCTTPSSSSSYSCHVICNIYLISYSIFLYFILFCHTLFTLIYKIKFVRSELKEINCGDKMLEWLFVLIWMTDHAYLNVITNMDVPK